MVYTYNHPKPMTYRFSQIVLGIASVLVVFSGGMLLIFGFIIPQGFLFIPMGIVTWLLLLPLTLATSATPPITITEDGIELRPMLWSNMQVNWQDIVDVKNYPLLPSEDSELLRKGMVGRKNYQVAGGMMLVVNKLPLNYRVVGFFAGEGFRPAIAFTNRSHENYAQLITEFDRHYSAHQLEP